MDTIEVIFKNKKMNKHLSIAIHLSISFYLSHNLNVLVLYHMFYKHYIQ